MVNTIVGNYKKTKLYLPNKLILIICIDIVLCNKINLLISKNEINNLNNIIHIINETNEMSLNKVMEDVHFLKYIENHTGKIYIYPVKTKWICIKIY